MGERDLGVKTSMMQERDAGPDATVEAEEELRDGTLAELDAEEALEYGHDEDLDEARALDASDNPPNDYYEGEAKDLEGRK